MRYTVLTSRTFHNRITKYLGVLVGAALLVALGLPGVAQAQVPAAPTAEYVDNTDTFTVTTQHGNLQTDTHNYWVFEYDSPSASADQRAVLVSSNTDGELDDIRSNRAEGKWTFRVRTIAGNLTTTDGPDVDEDRDAVTATTKGAIRVDGDMPTYIVPNDLVAAASRMGSWSAKTNYTHGSSPMPQNFTYVSRPGADTHIFSWTDASKGDDGIEDYTLRWTDGDPALLATKWEMEEGIGNLGVYTLNSDQTAKLMDGMYTFELRAIGVSSSTVKGDPESDPATLMVPIGMVPTPTLPELAALFLALLLLGSGAYLLRGRQLGGLTRA